MRARVAQHAVVAIFISALCGVIAASEKLSDLQARFDSETNGVHKAKLLQRLGDAEFEEAGHAANDGDFTTVGLIMEKYRDNVRAASTALQKDNPDGERHPNGYKQLEMHLQKSLRELDEFLLEAPDPFKPPLQIVRQDLLHLDDELIRILFPRKHENKPPATPTPASNPPDPGVRL
jgi:hypothetical protein